MSMNSIAATTTTTKVTNAYILFRYQGSQLNHNYNRNLEPQILQNKNPFQLKQMLISIHHQFNTGEFNWHRNCDHQSNKYLHFAPVSMLTT
jgi:hypothetical protein